MPDPKALVSFPGINQILEASYTNSRGIAAGTAEITLVPQLDFIGEGGDLIFGFMGLQVVYKQCRVDRLSFVRNERGLIWHLRVWDRRWKWKDTGFISGCYNTRAANGDYDQKQLRSPQALAALCLTAMGETAFDVSQLPNDTLPEINWEGACPAQELENLANSLGCHVVLDIFDMVRVCRMGYSAIDLPADGVFENSLTIDPPQRPDAIWVICGKTSYQMRFVLEAVGKDYPYDVQAAFKARKQIAAKTIAAAFGAAGATPAITAAAEQAAANLVLPPNPPGLFPPIDGQIRRLNDLAYAPPIRPGRTFAFENEAPPLFGSIGDPEIKVQGLIDYAVKYAQETVFRWYRIKAVNACPGLGQNVAIGSESINDAFLVPGYGKLLLGAQILPILSTMNDGVFYHDALHPDDQSAANPLRFESKPAEVRGIFAAQVWNARPETRENTEVLAYYDKKFSIDGALGIVKFEDYVWKWSDDALKGGVDINGSGQLCSAGTLLYAEPNLYLETTVNVRDPITWAWDRCIVKKDYGTNYGTGPRVLRHDELILQVTAKYDDSHQTNQITKIVSNLSDIVQAANYYITAAEAEYNAKLPQEVRYMGFRAISCDGAIHQVTYTLTDKGEPFTSVSKNQEVAPHVEPYDVRRFRQRISRRFYENLQASIALAHDEGVPGARPK